MKESNISQNLHSNSPIFTQCALLLGTNVGDRYFYIKMAQEFLERISKTPLVLSEIYETEPVGPEGQQPYLNQAVLIQTELSAESLLFYCKGVEKLAGRKFREFWGSRELDIDILFFGQEISEVHKPFLPHPWLHKRRFTMVPLNEIASTWFHPLLKKSVNQLFSELVSDEAPPTIFTPQES